MATRIKICGLTNDHSVQAAAQNGAAFFGIVHFPKSPRHVDLRQAARLIDGRPDMIEPVLLLVNPDISLLEQIRRDMGRLTIQLHGSESAQDIAQWRDRTGHYFWKALPAMTRRSLDKAAAYKDMVDYILFDTPPPAAASQPGGNGIAANWALFSDFAPDFPWGIAGGLTPDNVAEAMAATHARLVDVSTGVESERGVKDVDKIARFCQAVRDYDTD